MIRALYNLGKIYEERELDETIEGDFVIKVKFEEKEGEVKYLKSELFEFSKKLLKKITYVKGSGGSNLSPTLVFAKQETLVKNFSSCLKKHKSLIKIVKFLKEEKNKEKLENDILDLIKDKKTYFVTLELNGNLNSEITEIAEKTRALKEESYYKDNNDVVSLGREKVCYCCKKKKENVYGFVSTYKFYTVDKKGFIVGGFNSEKSWKNYPICSECAERLENGKKYIENKFSESFAGFSYMVIPKPIFEIKNEEELDNYDFVLRDFEKKIKISTSEPIGKTLLTNENDMMEIMSEMGNNISFNIMFYKKNNNEFKILLNIEDVLPSRLRNIFKIKEEVEKNKIFKNIFSNSEYPDLKFNFGIIRDFFPNKKIEGNWDKNFLEIINSIFINKKIDYQFLIKNFLRVIYMRINDKEKFNKNANYIEFHSDFKKSWIILKFLIKMNLLINKESGVIKEMIERNEKNEVYLNFFDEHSETFDSDIKRAIFLEGIFVQKLLNIQGRESGSSPFYARLNGLKMNEKIIKRVFVEAVNKLNEYKKGHWYKGLEKLISEYFTSSNFNEISKDEMSYYFVLGLNLADKFKKQEIETEEE